MRTNKRRMLGLLACSVISSVLVAGPAGVGQAAPAGSGSADPRAVTDWNATMVATVIGDAKKGNAEAFVWYGFTELAVYNAVNGITHAYQLYAWDQGGPRGASPEAAAAVAAHDVLLRYFPGSQARLDAALSISLDRVPDGVSKDQGVRYGEQAAAHIVELRADDGRDNPVTFDQPTAPGVWRPTPPAYQPMLAPWMSQIRPLTLQSPSQFRPAAPPALSSSKYAADFNEAKVMGAKTGSPRTAAQSQTALFFSDTPVGAVQAGLRDLAIRHQLDISEAARLLAAVDTAFSDTIVAVWDAKYHYGLWRPITAIALADDDGNPATTAESDWQPFITTPPYTEYPAGTPAIYAALARALPELTGSNQLDIRVSSIAAGSPGSPLSRTYDDPAALITDVTNARVWSGVHYRNSDEVGVTIGLQVADWVLGHEFQAR